MEGKDGYVKYFKAKVLPELMAIDGLLSVDIFVRPVSEGQEIMVITKWDMEENIRRFAGQDICIANVQSEAAGFLQAFDFQVTHFTIEVGVQTKVL